MFPLRLFAESVRHTSTTSSSWLRSTFSTSKSNTASSYSANQFRNASLVRALASFSAIVPECFKNSSAKTVFSFFSSARTRPRNLAAPSSVCASRVSALVSRSSGIKIFSSPVSGISFPSAYRYQGCVSSNDSYSQVALCMRKARVFQGSSCSGGIHLNVMNLANFFGQSMKSLSFPSFESKRGSITQCLRVLG